MVVVVAIGGKNLNSPFLIKQWDDGDKIKVQPKSQVGIPGVLPSFLHGSLAYGRSRHRWKVNLMVRDKTLILDGSVQSQRTQKKEKGLRPRLTTASQIQHDEQTGQRRNQRTVFWMKGGHDSTV